MNICVIGDSHVGSFRLCLKDHPLPGHEVDFFAHPSHTDCNMGMLSAVGNRLVPTNDGLRKYLKRRFKESRIFPLKYDVVLLVGLRLEFPYILAGDYSRQLGSTLRFCSKPVLLDALQDLITVQSLALRIVEEIRKIDQEMPLIVIPNPLLSVMMKSLIMPTVPGIVPAAKIHGDRPFDCSLIDEWYAAMEQIFSGYGAHVIRQPLETVENGIFTKAQFALDNATPPGIRHMNAHYWQHLRQEVINRISRHNKESSVLQATKNLLKRSFTRRKSS